MIAVVASLYNADYVNPLVDAVHRELGRVATGANLQIYRVPGACEIPVTAEYLAQNAHPDVIVALGLIIRGETAHADLIARSVFDELQRIATRHVIPTINEVLLVENHEQARERCLGVEKNRGTEAARAAAQMCDLFHTLRTNQPYAKGPKPHA